MPPASSPTSVGADASPFAARWALGSPCERLKSVGDGSTGLMVPSRGRNALEALARRRSRWRRVEGSTGLGVVLLVVVGLPRGFRNPPKRLHLQRARRGGESLSPTEVGLLAPAETAHVWTRPLLRVACPVLLLQNQLIYYCAWVTHQKPFSSHATLRQVGRTSRPSLAQRIPVGPRGLARPGPRVVGL